MSNSMSGLYQNLLSTPQPSLETQQRAFEWAMRAKDHGLVVSLLNHSALHADIDAKIRDVDAAAVKAAWAARPGRTSDELVGLVANEQRATVLGALAERDDLPAEVYMTLAAKAKGVRVLRRVIANSDAPVAARKLALQRVLVPFEGPVGPRGLDKRTLTEYQSTMREGADLVEPIIAAATDLHVLAAAMNCGHAISRDQQVLFANGLVTNFAEAVKTAESNYNSLMGQILDICRQFVDANIDVDHDAADTLVGLISGHLPVADRWMKGSEEVMIADLNKAKERESALDLYDFSKVASFEEFEEMFDKVNDAKYGSFTDKEVLLLARAVVACDFAFPYHAAQAADWSYHRDMSEWLSLTKDVEKQAALINSSWYIGDLDQLLSALDDPRAVLVELLELDHEELRHLDAVIASTFMTDDLLAKVPAEAFFANDAKLRLSEYAALRLTEAKLSEQAWSTLETLSLDFTGSFDELITVATSV